jgi:hypothetical protein
MRTSWNGGCATCAAWLVSYGVELRTRGVQRRLVHQRQELVILRLNP